MASVNFRGNIGKIRGLQYGADNTPRLSFSVGEGHNRYDKQSQSWESVGTTWWNVTVFGRQAEDLADVLQEGAKQVVVVSGRSQTRDYEHNGEQRSSLDVVADHVGLVHRAPRQTQPAATNSGFNTAPASNSGQGDVWGGGGSGGNWGTPTSNEVQF